MNYDIEREKQKSEEIRQVCRQMFPLADETDLPWAATQLPGFLAARIKHEVEQGTKNFTMQLCKVLCEISTPKTHIIDMARICVDEAKAVPKLNETIQSQAGRIDFLQKQMKWLEARLKTAKTVADIGLDERWIDLSLAIEKARKEEG